MLHILSGGNNKDIYRPQTSPFTDTDYELLRSLQENTNDEVFEIIILVCDHDISTDVVYAYTPGV